MKQLLEQQQASQPDMAAKQQQAAELEAQVKQIINQILTPDARERLANIRISRPPFARQIELFLIQLHQTGRLPAKLTDEQLKKILARLSEQKREINITRR